VTLRPDATVSVSFTVDDTRPLDTRTEVAIKYENLTGDRYLALSPGTSGQTRPLTAGAVIPADRTTPALDINSLVGGFKPLFASVDADDINELTSSLVAVLQGQGSTTASLLQHLGSLTSSLAEQDSVIGDVVDNFNTVLGTVETNRGKVSAAVVDLEQLIHEFAARPDPLGAVIDRLRQATESTTDLLATVRPDLAATVKQIDRLAGNLDADKDELAKVISSLPAAYKRLARMGAYGSVFQLYACGATLRLSDPNGDNTDIPLLNQTVGRCAP
jgi:phospholipid/cholesterol/gamma-HCH transport system substrate-binding protein